MKFISVAQCLVNQDGKIEDVGIQYLLPSEVISVKEIWDKHEVVISSVCLVTFRNGLNFVAGIDIKKFMELIEESFV